LEQKIRLHLDHASPTGNSQKGNPGGTHLWHNRLRCNLELTARFRSARSADSNQGEPGTLQLNDNGQIGRTGDSPVVFGDPAELSCLSTLNIIASAKLTGFGDLGTRRL
jgi:hypothetical protein